jgi:hypothetical protein
MKPRAFRLALPSPAILGAESPGCRLARSQGGGSTSATGYHLVAPLGPSGIAFLGEKAKLALRGKRCLAEPSDEGPVTVTVQCVTAEGPARPQGYAPSSKEFDSGSLQ